MLCLKKRTLKGEGMILIFRAWKGYHKEERGQLFFGTEERAASNEFKLQQSRARLNSRKPPLLNCKNSRKMGQLVKGSCGISSIGGFQEEVGRNLSRMV